MNYFFQHKFEAPKVVDNDNVHNVSHLFMKNLILDNPNQPISNSSTNGLHRRNNSPLPTEPTLINSTNTDRLNNHQHHNKREQSEEKEEQNVRSFLQTNYSSKNISNYTTRQQQQQQQQHQIIPQHSIPWIVGLLLMMNLLCFGIAMYNKELGSSLHENYVENMVDIGHNVNIAFRSLFSHYNIHNSNNNNINTNLTLNNNIYNTIQSTPKHQYINPQPNTPVRICLANNTKLCLTMNTQQDLKLVHKKVAKVFHFVSTGHDDVYVLNTTDSGVMAVWQNGKQRVVGHPNNDGFNQLWGVIPNFTNNNNEQNNDKNRSDTLKITTPKFTISPLHIPKSEGYRLTALDVNVGGIVGLKTNNNNNSANINNIISNDQDQWVFEQVPTTTTKATIIKPQLTPKELGQILKRKLQQK